MIPDSEYNMAALVIIGGSLGTVFLMMLWDAWCQMQRDRRRGSYQRHPSQRTDLYQQKNKGETK